MVTRLARPSLALRTSWAACVGEFDGASGMHGSGLWHLPEAEPLDTTEDGCRRLIEMLDGLGDPDAPRPDGLVPSDYFWVVDDDDEVVGFLALRHHLNDFLLELGGHIGYSVRPSRRREGHAKRALGLAVRRAAGLGLERVLVTCDADNRASAEVIEANGGVLEDERSGKRRYWIDTADRGHSGR